jgi:hypothetical protein
MQIILEDVKDILLGVSIIIMLLIVIMYYLNQRNYHEKFKKIEYVEQNCINIFDINKIDKEMQNMLVFIQGFI